MVKKMNNSIMYVICIVVVLVIVNLVGGDEWVVDVGSETTTDGWSVDLIPPDTPINYSLIPTVNSSDYWDDLDTPADIDHNLLNNLEWSVAGHTMDTELDMEGNGINNVGDLNVSGNASFTGPFETDCLHCEDGDTYFHGDGFFEGNVTAPNIEVMESLIVHGNSTCTGTATACGDIADRSLCGWTTWLGQRGCRWTLGGNCIGTATPCDEMSTATCEEQHVCSLTSGTGFIFGVDGLNLGSNNITNVSYINGINISNLSNQYVPYSGAVSNIDLGIYNITTTGSASFGSDNYVVLGNGIWAIDTLDGGRIGGGLDLQSSNLDNVGIIFLGSDDSKYYAGESQDVAFSFDGTQGKINAEVGSPVLNFSNFGNYSFDDDITTTGNVIANSFRADAYEQTITADEQTIAHTGQTSVSLTLDGDFNYYELGSTNPVFSDGTQLGQIIVVRVSFFGFNYLTIKDNSANGKVILQGDKYFASSDFASDTEDVLILTWDGSVWREIYRNLGFDNDFSGESSGWGESNDFTGDYAGWGKSNEFSGEASGWGYNNAFSNGNSGWGSSNTFSGGSAGWGSYNTFSGSNAGWGYRNIATAYQVVFGRYSTSQGHATNWVATDDLFKIGIGTSTSVRANAFRMLKNGESHWETDSKHYYGLGNDISIQFDGSDLVFNSENITAADEIHFTNFDKYTFDNEIVIGTGATIGITKTTDDLPITCATDKTMVLSPVVYKDINMAGYLLAKPASSAPGIVTFVDENGTDTNIETYGFAVGEKVHGGFELQHDYKQGTDLVFHVHWQGITAPTGTDNVQWRLKYIVMRDGTTLNSAVTIDSPDTVFDTQYETVRTDFTAITGTNFLIGDQFMFTLERVASTGDAYAGEALIETAGIHYQVDTIGSRQIILK